MRKFLIKHFEGGTSVKIGKNYYNFHKTMPLVFGGVIGFGIGITFKLLLFQIVFGAIIPLTIFTFLYFFYVPLTRDEVKEFFPEQLEDFDKANRK